MRRQAPGSWLQAPGRAGLQPRSRDKARSPDPGAWSRRVVALFAACAVLLVRPALGAEVPRTLRLDFFHTGTAAEERFSVDRLVLEPLTWPGNPGRPVDDTNLGKYLFEVIERSSNRVVYSRGFASIYGEWETTGEAKAVTRTFSESLRFPMPASPVQVVVKKRDRHNAFREVWSTLVDPGDIFIDRSRAPSPGALIPLLSSGDSASKVDVLILGDGYTAAERTKFEKDARRLVDILFATSPFKERKADFNLWGLCPPAAESGILRPSTVSGAARLRARNTTRSAPSATCSRSTTARSATSRRSRRTSSWRSCSTERRTAAAAFSTCTQRWPPTAPGRRTSSCTSSGTTSRAWPTSTTPPTSRTCRQQIPSSRGRPTPPC